MTAWMLLMLAAAAAQPADGACAAASSPLRFPAGLVSPALVERVEAYRRSWKGACAARGGVSVGPLLGEAVEIEKAFRPLLSKLEGEEGLLDRMPEVLPAFVGSSHEILFLRVDLDAFEALSKTKGTAEDRRFFEAYLRLRGNDPFPPWVERTVDYGGCQRLGSYEWATAFDAARELAASVRSGAYVQMTRALTAELLDPLDAISRGGEVCVCEARARALSALDAAASRLGARADPRPAVAARGAADAVRSGRSRARWECRSP